MWKIELSDILILICSFVILSIAVWKYFKLEIVRVCGKSMYPTLKPNKLVLITKRTSMTNFFMGNRIYIFRDPTGKTVIKRLIRPRLVMGGLYLWFEGDNKEVSYDSRNYGYVDAFEVEGRLVFNRKNKNK